MTVAATEAAEAFDEEAEECDEQAYTDQMDEYLLADCSFRMTEVDAGGGGRAGGSRSGAAGVPGAGGFAHFYSKNVLKTVNPPRYMMKEVRKIKKTLPDAHSNSSIFVLVDEQRMDMMRAVVTGPVGELRRVHEEHVA
jgi:hypothetical protein